MNSPAQDRSCGRLGLAYGLGVFLYLVMLVQDPPDGLVFMLPFHIMIASVFTVVLGGVALLCGKLLLALPLLSNWHASWIPAFTLCVVGTVLVFFGELLGLTTVIHDTGLDVEYTATHPSAAFGGVFAVLFGVLNYPIQKKTPVNRTVATPRG